MPFRAYLRTFDGAVSEKTLTNDPTAALAAFAALVNRTDLDGQPLAAALTGDSKQVAYHRFDRNPGDADYWRGRIEELEIPGFGKVGRPKIMEDARRRNISIDDASWEIAQRLGSGNASDGIRKALKSAEYSDRLHLAAIDLAHDMESHVLAVAKVREALDAVPSCKITDLLQQKLDEVKALLREIRASSATDSPPAP